MKCMDKVKVWNHTLGGKLIEEGIAILRRKDLSFRNEHIDALLDQGETQANEKTKRIEGKFERWMITFDGESESPVSRWVRKEDIIDPFAKINKRLAGLAEELGKDPALMR